MTDRLKKLGINFTNSETVCAAPETPLLTLNADLSSNFFKTKNFSVPIPILLPTDIFLGIVETNMSVTIPDVLFAGISWYNTVLAVSIPILCDFVKFLT